MMQHRKELKTELSTEAGQRGAIICTIIESCRRRKIDPDGYLPDVLTRLPHLTNHQIQKLTPSEWAKPQSNKSLTTAS